MWLFDFFWKFIEDSFLTLASNTAIIEITDIIIVFFWSIILSLIIGITYRGTHRSISYSQNFTQTLVLLGIIVGMLMIIVGTDVARAFTLIGAFSIIRFRNALKETRDVGFIFFVMAVGMACGIRFYLVGIMLTLVVCSLMYFMTYTQFGKKGLAQDIIELDFPVTQDYTKVLSPIFVRHLKYYSMLGLDSIDENTNRISFIVTFKKKTKLVTLKKSREFSEELDSKVNLLADIQKISFISNVKVIDGSNSVEI
ncbi:hypothetical protein LCGC14_0933080 [marine sediment metagenome]|uniref:DUF4956 domain-containing protein n=1 Tax=marine sediment metagenome TaxID=412755 RepID=A0A0F9RTV4_9ZZZZ|nr:DUF4956 domain-containing protein [bacterium]